MRIMVSCGVLLAVRLVSQAPSWSAVGLGPSVQNAEASRVRVARSDGQTTAVVRVGSVAMGEKDKLESVRLLLSYDTGTDIKKLKVVPLTKVVEALVLEERLEALKQSTKAAFGVSAVTIDATVNRFGYEFSTRADASGKPQPYLFGQIYDGNGSTQGKRGAPPIGVVAAYPLSDWRPDNEGFAHLPLPIAFSSSKGTLVVWRCIGDKAIWVESIPWTGETP